ncbi:MAG: hypothetical protein V1668_04985 [Patescibacteria group bacterium]
MATKPVKISRIQTTGLYKKILIGFSIVAVIMAGLIVYYSMSKTTITVTLRPTAKTSTLSVLVRKNAAEQESNTVTAISGILTSIEVKGSKTFDNVSSGDEVPAQATGTVTIFNNYSKDQPLAATTRLLTPDGLLFRIKNRTDVPAGGKVEDVEVYADQPGKTGNIGPVKFTIPGLWLGLQDKIYAESSTAMTGGLRSGKSITQAFINESAKTLLKDLTAQAVADLAVSDENRTAVTAEPSMLYPVILSQQESAKDGEEAAAVSIDLRVKFIVVLFDVSALTSLADNGMADNLPIDEQIDTDSTPALAYSVESYDLKTESAMLAVSYTADIVPRLSNPMFNRDQVVGHDAQEIKSYFSHFDQVKDVQIKFSPFWVTKAPQLKDHIEIKLTR